MRTTYTTAIDWHLGKVQSLNTELQNIMDLKALHEKAGEHQRAHALSRQFAEVAAALNHHLDAIRALQQADEPRPAELHTFQSA